MKKRSIFVAAAVATVLTGCIHTEQEPMPPGVFIKAPAPDTGVTPMPPADNDSFKPVVQKPVLLPPAPAPEPKKAVKKPVKKVKTARRIKRAPARFRATEEKYIVKKGDNLSRIAYRYCITVKALQEYNKLKTTVIHPKQVLLIPASKAVPAKGVTGKKVKAVSARKGARKAAAGKDMPQGNVHIVRAGEDFTRIARLYRIKVSDIQKANPGVDSRRLQIGQKLNLVPGAKSVTAVPAETAKPADPAAEVKTPAPGNTTKTPAAVIDGNDLFNDVKDPEALTDKAPAASAAPTAPATSAAPAAPASNEVLGAEELNNAAASVTDEVVTMDGGKQAVTIRTGDTTIDALAKRFNSTPEKIREANGLLPADGTIKVGTKVIIP